MLVVPSKMLDFGRKMSTSLPQVKESELTLNIRVCHLGPHNSEKVKFAMSP